MTNAFDTLATATSFEDAASAVVGMFGADARLYAVDHEFGHLIAITGSEESIELSGELRTAMLGATATEHGDDRWTPLPEGDDVVFAVKHSDPSSLGRAERAVVGALLCNHRRRFELPERARRRADMVVAAEMQWDTLPIRAVTLGGYSVAAVLEPAYEVAGDVFDYAFVDQALWIYSFDGMGHGLDATISSVLVLSAVRNSRRQGLSLGEQMAAANTAVFDQYGGDRFVTGAACRLDADGSTTIVNAGHEPIRTVRDGHVDRLDLLADLPLGVEPAIDFREQTGPALRPVDGLVMFSDGPANQVVDGESFGSDRLDDTLGTQWTSSPLRTGHDVVDDVLQFIGDGQVEDDITVVVVRRLESTS